MKRTYSLLQDSNNETRMKKRPTNIVEIKWNPIISIRARITRMAMLIKIKIPALFINNQFKIQVLWFSFLSLNKFIFLSCIKQVKLKIKTAMSVMTLPLFPLKAPLPWIQIFVFLNCSKIKRTCFIWLWMGNGKFHCKVESSLIVMVLLTLCNCVRRIIRFNINNTNPTIQNH